MKIRDKVLVVAILLLLAIPLAAAITPGQIPWKTVAAKTVEIPKGTTTKVVSIPNMGRGNVLGTTFVGYGALDINNLRGNPSGTSTLWIAQQTATATTSTAPVLPNICVSTTAGLVILRYGAATASPSTINVLYVPGD
jgi:hypothetical protein